MSFKFRLPSLNQFKNFRFTNLSLNENVKKAIDFYEEALGIKEVKKTQESVLKAESEFVESSKITKNNIHELNQLQEQLRQIKLKLDTIHRTDEAYLPLITKEHQLVKTELQLKSSLELSMENERNLLTKFSQKLREAHEVERIRQEKTKYLSVILSIVGACLGIIATSINYALKKKDFKEILEYIKNHVDKSYSNDIAFDSRPISHVENRTIETQTESLPKLDEIVEVINTTESNLEYKMKINSLATIAALYSLLALTVPFILKLFTGGN